MLFGVFSYRTALTFKLSNSEYFSLDYHLKTQICWIPWAEVHIVFWKIKKMFDIILSRVFFYIISKIKFALCKVTRGL